MYDILWFPTTPAYCAVTCLLLAAPKYSNCSALNLESESQVLWLFFLTTSHVEEDWGIQVQPPDKLHWDTQLHVLS